MELQIMALQDIKPYKRNARKNDHAVDAVAESIRQCGYVAPIIVDEDCVILAGHTRWKALKQLGRDQCEVVVRPGLSEEQKRKYRLLDNKTTELAEWDYELLAAELDGLDFGGAEFDWGLEFGSSNEEEQTPSRKLRDYGGTKLDDSELEQLRQRVQNSKYVYYSYSGGRDSTRALVLTYQQQVDMGKQVEVLYVDNGYELPDIKCHILRVCQQIGAKLRILHSDIDFLTYYGEKNRLPDSIHRDCIELTINRPMDQYIASVVGEEDYVLVRGGQPKQRTALSSTQLYQTVESKPHMIIWNPLFEMSAEDLAISVPEWPGYKNGFDRTACWCCPFQKPKQWTALQKWYPMLHTELQGILSTTPFVRHPGDGYLKYIDQYWAEGLGVDVMYK